LTQYWTVADIMRNLRYPSGRPAFSSAASVRSWIARHRNAGHFTHHPTERRGPKDAHVYDPAEITLWWDRQRSRADKASKLTSRAPADL